MFGWFKRKDQKDILSYEDMLRHGYTALQLGIDKGSYARRHNISMKQLSACENLVRYRIAKANEEFNRTKEK